MAKLSQCIINAVHRYIQLDHYAPHQYCLRYWDASLQAWREGSITNRERALREQFETRVRMALTMLGFEPDEAGAIANSACYNAYPMDWRQCVREELKADKLATENSK